MCLGIPGEIVEILPNTLTWPGSTSAGSSGRSISGLLTDDKPVPGDWILIHVGFALSKIDEAEAKSAMDFLKASVRPTRTRSRRCSSRGSTKGVELMRFVDEYRDAEKARALAAKIAGAVRAGATVQVHGGLRGPHAHHLQARPGGLPAGEQSRSCTGRAARSA